MLRHRWRRRWRQRHGRWWRRWRCRGEAGGEVVEVLLGEAKAVREVGVVIGGGLELPSQRGADLHGERHRRLGLGSAIGVGVWLGGGLTAERGADIKSKRDPWWRVGVGLRDEEDGWRGLRH